MLGLCVGPMGSGWAELKFMGFNWRFPHGLISGNGFNTLHNILAKKAINLGNKLRRVDAYLLANATTGGIEGEYLATQFNGVSAMGNLWANLGPADEELSFRKTTFTRLGA